MQCILSQLDFEYVVILDKGQLWQILHFSYQLHSSIFLDEAEIDLILLCHSVEDLSYQVLLKIDYLALYQTHRFVVYHQIISEIVLNVDFVGRIIFPNIPTLNVVIIEDKSWEVVLFL